MADAWPSSRWRRVKNRASHERCFRGGASLPTPIASSWDWKKTDRPCGLVREVLQHYRGREISTTGDGFLAAFDGPARAIRCANALGDAVRPLGLMVRCGIHTGECELIGQDLAGIAVHIGARVAALAAPGEVLVSQTVRDLVAGSGLAFEDRGSHSLKGVPDEWRLFRAVLN